MQFENEIEEIQGCLNLQKFFEKACHLFKVFLQIN